jgi:hypothetical protein
MPKIVVHAVWSRVLLGTLAAVMIAAFGACAQSDPILQRFLPQARAGNPQAEYAVGARYYQMGDKADAKQWLQKAAAQGNQQAAGFLKYFLGGASTGAAPSPSFSSRPAMASTHGGLCPFSGGDVEKNGIRAELQQSDRMIPRADSDARLAMVMLTSFGACTYQYYSPSRRQILTFAAMPGGMRSMGAQSEPSEPPVPDTVIDLPAAIKVAMGEGMKLPLKSATLHVAQPRGRQPIAVWLLNPAQQAGGRIDAYVVAAADPGRPLTVNDVSDVERDYDARATKIIDEFRAGSVKNASGPKLDDPCVSYNVYGTPSRGMWLNLPEIHYFPGGWVEHWGLLCTPLP